MSREELEDEIQNLIIDYKYEGIDRHECFAGIAALFDKYQKEIDDQTEPFKAEKPKMSKEQITKAEELISDTIRKVDKLFGLL